MGLHGRFPQLLMVVFAALLIQGCMASSASDEKLGRKGRALSSSFEPPATVSSLLLCNPRRQCSSANDCVKEQCAATTQCIYGYCYNKAYTSNTKYVCSDDNPCTTGDYCLAGKTGAGSCQPGTGSPCDYALPPNPALRSCYDKPTCNVTDGTCSFQYNANALQAAQSAAAACSTWGGAFATGIATNRSVDPASSLAWSQCLGNCSANICVNNIVPECSCMATAFSTSIATASTTCTDYCPLKLLDLDPTACSNTKCNAGGYYTCSGTSCPPACWYPNSDPKSGKAGMLYPCPSNSITSFTVTGGTAISQCAGCVSIGAIYDKSGLKCYGGNVTVAPVDPPGK